MAHKAIDSIAELAGLNRLEYVNQLKIDGNDIADRIENERGA